MGSPDRPVRVHGWGLEGQPDAAPLGLGVLGIIEHVITLDDQVVQSSRHVTGHAHHALVTQWRERALADHGCVHIVSLGCRLVPQRFVTGFTGNRFVNTMVFYRMSHGRFIYELPVSRFAGWRCLAFLF